MPILVFSLITLETWSATGGNTTAAAAAPKEDFGFWAFFVVGWWLAAAAVGAKFYPDLSSNMSVCVN